AAYRKPPSRTDIDPTILRFAYWPLLASFTFFTTINLGGYGVYVFPLAAIAILVALWARDAGPWALAAGGALSALTALLQWWRELEAIRQPTNAPEEHLIMPWWSLTVLLVCGIAAAAGAPFWPNWWSYVIFAPSLIGWAALFLPETPPETLFFALPGMLLVTAGFARCVVGTYQRGPVKEEKDEPMYPELERSESRRVS
ncbi:MAG TPA: hypothetical protein VI818_05045, partial [Candidatus Thermoplasmatota archaeon]|nr:hypothetical protein [Candidatus Thermoplasmatota archaeon]